MSVKSIQIQTGRQRTFFIIGAVICVLGTVFFVKWCLGHAMSTRAEQKEIADMSTGFAPDDPQTHYAAGVLHEQSFQPEDWALAVSEYEKAAALSPNNYLLWLALGKAQERNGEVERAEQSLLRAVELAPNYASTHWALGNNLLRQRKNEQAFEQIRNAAVANDSFIIPAISTAWQIFQGDVTQIKQSIGDSPKLNAYLSVFLLNQEKYNEAFEIWNQLSEEMKSGTYREQSEQIYQRLLSVNKYRYARQVKSAMDGQSTTNIFGKFTYGNFENNRKQKPDFFDWQIADGGQPLIGYDDKIKHGGELSLVLIFNSPNGQDFRSITQTVAVEPGKSYTFEGFYKSELKTSNTFRWEVLNAIDRTVISATEPVAENSDWARISADFTVPENGEAVVINLVRLKCGSTICPLTGKIWFDDFVITER